MINTMREILFRGKRVENGKWINGSVLSFDDGGKVILPSEAKAFKERGTTTICCNKCYDVYPETVGQFTGLTDKNGNKIFEGDIVKIKGKIRYIFYGISSFRHTNYGEYAEELKDVNTDRDCEIVSNIHDNPELLEGSNE